VAHVADLQCRRVRRTVWRPQNHQAVRNRHCAQSVRPVRGAEDGVVVRPTFDC
jgi:hypothetical protein